MSPDDEPAIPYHPGFPRVSGDEPFCSRFVEGNLGFSPRERG